MATINLLPWRDEYRQEKKREFLSALVLLAIVAAVLSYGWIAMTKLSIENQQERNQLLKTEIAQLEKKVKEIESLKKTRTQLEERIEVIQNLQNKRPLVVRYFDEVVKAIPDGLYLKSFKRTGESFAIQGVAESNSRVSALMRNLDRSPVYQSPNLKNVVKDGFDLTVGAGSGVAAKGGQ